MPLSPCCKSPGNIDPSPVRGALDRAEDHRQALDVVRADRLRRSARPHALDELAEQAGVPAALPRLLELRKLDVGVFGPETPGLRHGLGAEAAAAVPERAPPIADETPIGAPVRVHSVRAP